MKLHVQRHLKCWLCLASLLWEHKFNCGITGLRKAEGQPSTSTTDDNIETVKKMIADNDRITIRYLLMF